jgi:glutamyl-tRNA synthetase
MVAMEKHMTPEILPILRTLTAELEKTEWMAEAIHHAIEHAVTSNGLKFPKVAMPLRLVLTGVAQSPSIDQVMDVLGKKETLARLSGHLS